VGLIPLFAVERLERDWLEPFAEFRGALDWFLRNRRDLVASVVHPVEKAGKLSYALTIVDRGQLTRLMDRVWNEAVFWRRFNVRLVTTPTRNVAVCGSAIHVAVCPLSDEHAALNTLALTVPVPSGNRPSATLADDAPPVSGAVTENEMPLLPVTCRHCAPAGTVLSSMLASPSGSPSSPASPGAPHATTAGPKTHTTAPNPNR
jgi:hypothetical protein